MFQVKKMRSDLSEINFATVTRKYKLSIERLLLQNHEKTIRQLCVRANYL